MVLFIAFISYTCDILVFWLVPALILSEISIGLITIKIKTDIYGPQRMSLGIPCLFLLHHIRKH